jgi:hypothetical protein
VIAIRSRRAFLLFPIRQTGSVLATLEAPSERNLTGCRWRHFVETDLTRAKSSHVVPVSGFRRSATAGIMSAPPLRVHHYPDGRLAIFDGPRCLACFDPNGKPNDAISQAA